MVHWGKMKFKVFCITVLCGLLTDLASAEYSEDCQYFDSSASNFGEYSLGGYQLIRQYVNFVPFYAQPACKGEVSQERKTDDVVYVRMHYPYHSFAVILDEQRKGWGLIPQTDTTVTWLYIDDTWQVLSICDKNGFTSVAVYMKGGRDHLKDGDLGSVKAFMYENFYPFYWENYWEICS